VASKDDGVEATIAEVQRRCVLIVARDVASHAKISIQQYGQLGHWCKKMFRRIMHHVWGPAVRMVYGVHMGSHALGVDFRGKQLLDVCLVVLGGTVRVADSMPQGGTCANMEQLRDELKIIAQLTYQRAELDCVI
tara:strand:- start:538 stop:942 length:405 start_codon:yes stop_codon:yes gene_type:complete